MKKVAFLTTFYEVTSGFSVIGVCETQVRMLLDHGYDPVVLVQEGCYHEDADGNPAEPGAFEEQPPPSVWNRQTVDLRPAVPALKLEGPVAADFDDRVARILAALRENLAEAEACVTHDVMLLPVYLEHNVAAREYAKERPDLLWLHWLHSCPTPSRVTDWPSAARYSPPPGYLVYPNHTDASQVCQTYGLGGLEWRVKVTRSGHAVDPLLAWPYHEVTKELARRADLLAGEFAAVYPARLDRGKQPEKIVRVMAGLQKAGREPRLLVIDWQSGGERFQKYIDELLELSAELGLEGKVSFSSRLDDRCSQGVPRRVVLELMDLTNVYVHPSRVETYSLVVHEAALRGNLLVLNHDFPAMRELWGDAAVYMDFGSDRSDRQYFPDEQAFWDDEALRLVAEMGQNRAVRAKTRARLEWSPHALWKEFEPLLYLQPVGAG